MVQRERSGLYMTIPQCSAAGRHGGRRRALVQRSGHPRHDGRDGATREKRLANLEESHQRLKTQSLTQNAVRPNSQFSDSVKVEVTEYRKKCEDSTRN